MRIVHAAGWYFPSSTGGTEVYIDSLARELARSGIENIIFASKDGTSSERYEFQGVPVVRYPVFTSPTLPQLRGDEPHGGFEKFEELLSREKGDVYHQHSWTLGCSLFHLRVAKKLGLPAVVTFHLPNAICARGSMMLFGENACDGRMDAQRCSSCWSEARGLPRGIASMVSSFPNGLSRMFECVLPRRIGTALSSPRLIERKRKDFEEMVSMVDKIVVVNRWLREALILNGAPKDKVMISRHGCVEKMEKGIRKSRSNVLQVGYVGRWSNSKGVDLVVEAIRRMPLEAPINLSIHGVGEGSEEQAYRRKIIEQIGNDSRITIREGIPRSKVLARVSEFDLLVVPSRVMETGPYVVLEALSVGTPVMGSNLGGIAEWIKEGVNGLLLPFNQVDAWKDALTRIASNPSELDRFSFNEPLRSMGQVASEMKELYQSLLLKRSYA